MGGDGGDEEDSDEDDESYEGQKFLHFSLSIYYLFNIDIDSDIFFLISSLISNIEFHMKLLMCANL